MKDAFELLRAQQEKAPEGSACWMVAEQLMDICRAEPYSAELIAQDLKNKSMSIAEAERKIRDRADEKHRKNGGSSVCVSPKEAEEILRKFYGLPIARASAEARLPAGAGAISRGNQFPLENPPPASGGVGLDLADFL